MIFDVLSLAYLLPAMIYAALLICCGSGPGWLRLSARILAAGLAFVWLTLEVRHAFQGEYISLSIFGSNFSDAEWYTYSAAWLVFAGIGLAAGSDPPRRMAAPRVARRGELWSSPRYSSPTCPSSKASTARCPSSVSAAR